MRRDGRPFISGSEAPRLFSDVLGERPFEEYVAPELRKTLHPIDEVPTVDELTATPPAIANCGFAHLKRR